MPWVALDFGQGLNLDASPEELPPGTAIGGSNVRFREGYAERFRGMGSVYTTPTVTPYHIGHYTYGNTRYVIYQGLAKTFVDDGTTQTDITNVDRTGAIDDRWSGFSFNGIWYQNNGVDLPQWWNGTGTLTTDAAFPITYQAAWLRPFKNQIVGGDITISGVRQRGTFLFSTIADVGTPPPSWDVTDPTEDAGDQPLVETNGALIDGLAMGDVFNIYKDDAIHFAQPIASNAVFRFGRYPGNTGLLARGCVVDTPAGHVFVTPGFDLVLFNAQSGIQSLLKGRMFRWLTANINASYAKRSFLATNPATTEVLYCFPSGASEVCDKALVWNWTDNAFAVRDLSGVTYGATGQVAISNPNTWASSADTWATAGGSWGTNDYAPDSPRLILTRTAPGLAMFDANLSDYGSAFTASVRARIVPKAGGRMVYLRGLRPVIEAAAGTTVYVQISTATTPGGTLTAGTALPFVVGTDREIHPEASGLVVEVNFYSTANQPWRLKSCEADLKPQGRY